MTGKSKYCGVCLRPYLYLLKDCYRRSPSKKVAQC